MTTLPLPKAGPTLPRETNMVWRQIGWIGHRDGSVYSYDDHPMDSREPGGFSPLYVAIGTWEHLGDGKYGIKD
jgi:hypothetical protein